MEELNTLIAHSQSLIKDAHEQVWKYQSIRTIQAFARVDLLYLLRILSKPVNIGFTQLNSVLQRVSTEQSLQQVISELKEDLTTKENEIKALHASLDDAQVKSEELLNASKFRNAG